MAIDRVDRAREDAKRAESQRTNASKEQADARQRRRADFQSRYQTKLKPKEESKETRKQGGDKGEEQEAGLFNRIIEVHRQSGKQDDSSNQQRHDFHQREEQKEDVKEEKSHDRTSRTHTRGGEEHQRVEASHMDRDAGSGGSSGGGGEQSSGGGAGSGGGGSMRGGSGSNAQGGSSERSFSDTHPSLQQKKNSPFAVNSISGASFSDSGETGKQSGHGLSKEILDEIVEHVHLIHHQSGEVEMDIQLSESFFSGLRLRAVQTKEGVVITFICPNRVVKNAFIIHRPHIYAALKVKNITVSRIEIV